MGDRFKDIIEVLGYNSAQFAIELGLTKGSVYDIIHGRVKKISGPVFELLKIKFSVNPNWLLTGEGEMFLPGHGKVVEPETSAEDNSFVAINGNAKDVEVTADNVHHTIWFQELTKTKKWLVAAINDGDMDEELSDEIRDYLEMRLKVKKAIRKDRERVAAETRLSQKGEAG